jgi:peptidoglycan/xylan/chitin deacetylase (PgdA/CDA1 family)
MQRAKKAWLLGFFALACLPLLAGAAGGLILNGDLEIAGASGPANWVAGHWGNNDPVFTYPVAGVGGGKAAQTTVRTYSSGDAKWAPEPVVVVPGTEYTYSDQYKASIGSTLENEYQMSDGSFQYQFLAALPPASSFTEARATFKVPAGARTVSVFHYLEGVGTLTIDQVVLNEAGGVTPPPPPPPSADNLIPNPTLAPDSTGVRPLSWRNNRYGSNSATFDYPITAEAGTGLRVTVSSYVGGDAKWYHEEIPVAAGDFYEFSDQYRGTAPSYLGIQFRKNDGSFIYPNLGAIVPSSGWQTLDRSFSVPAGAVGMIVYHAAQGNGTLETAAYSLKKVANDPTKFSQGMLSISFDDGEFSAYENTVSVLDPLGLKSTHFIVSDYLSDNFPGYIKPPEVLDLEARGHEIGAHTRSHPDLTTLTAAEMQNEIAGSKNDLLALGVKEVNAIAYPFGAYDQQVEDLVAQDGFLGARSTNDGQNLRNTDKFALKRVPVNIGTTLASVQNEIGKALANKSWLVLVFHNIDNSGNTYSTSPSTFKQIANYIKQSAIKVVTISQGIGEMQ